MIYSEHLNYYYKGTTQNVLWRLEDHNMGRNISTANKGPWKLVFVRSFENRIDAEREERRLKRTNTKYLEWVIQQDYNEINNFISPPPDHASTSRGGFESRPVQHEQLDVQRAKEEMGIFKDCFNNKCKVLQRNIVDKVFLKEFGPF